MTDDDKGGPPALSKDPEKAPISLPTRVVHGAYVYIRHGFLPCRGCPDKCEEYDEDGTCAALDRLLEERIRSIMDLPSIHPETDAFLVVALARELTIQDVVLWRMSKTGPVVKGKDGEGQEARLLKSYHDSIGKMLKLATALAITPAKRQDLKPAGKNRARLLAAADE